MIFEKFLESHILKNVSERLHLKKLFYWRCLELQIGLLEEGALK